jgi:hypothetical protein
MLHFVTLLNQFSILVALCAVALTYAYRRNMRKGEDYTEAGYVYVYMLLSVAIASVIASWLVLVFARFWVYPVMMGVVVGLCTYWSYQYRNIE